MGLPSAGVRVRRKGAGIRTTPEGTVHDSRACEHAPSRTVGSLPYAGTNRIRFKRVLLSERLPAPLAMGVSVSPVRAERKRNGRPPR